MPKARSAAPLKTQAAAHHLLFGFALNVRQLRESESYRRLVLEQSSIAVAENAMKWSALRPAPDQYFFDDADFLVQFGEQNRIKLRGHNLCWHEQLPKWFDATANGANARTLLTEHIRTVAGRYAGRIHSWDVVNEAVEPRDGRPDGLRNSPWLRLIGETYLELAFRTARQADPTALLTYNDYDIEDESPYQAEKRAAVLRMLRRLKQRNVPIDAVGIQSHISAGTGHRYGASLQQFILSCREMDLEVFVTELDVDDRELPKQVAERDAGVAEAYRQYLDVVLREPNVRAVLTWGVDDAQSWLSGKRPRADGVPQRPLLWDAQFRPKKAVSAVEQAFVEARPAPAPAAGRSSRR
ncbi:endo-1,4-beta-xylanase [Terriglobus aquaticus]|uniref:Beta-xylanase n=1 Tax=Terriglobus aquaticus TaxID=940139 RepID=A0ABW9KK05_9BACT|nr:endo-1,4-beta-xylanase [Terriglobus aquaticus]